jgi:HK97 family phage major capsid protein
MTLAQLQQRKAAVRAQLEELLTLAGSRAFSTEENTRFTDLKAEGESLVALEGRYSILESLDHKPQATIIPAMGAARVMPTMAQSYAAIADFIRTGKQAGDVPLQIQQSVTDAGLVQSVPSDVVGDAVSLCGAIDLPSALGVRDFPRSSTNPLTVPFEIAEATVDTHVESNATSDSAPGGYGSVTLAGVCYDALVKYSYESAMNVGFNLGASVVRTIVLGQIVKQNSAFAAALKASAEAGSYATGHGYVDIYSGGADAHTSLTRLFAGLDPLFGDGVLLLNQSDFQIIQDSRPASGDGQPLVSIGAGTIMGKKYVLSNDVDRIYYGSWNLGAYRSQTPLNLLTLRELYSEKRQIGVKGSQFVDFAFASETAATKQPIVYGNFDAATS